MKVQLGLPKLQLVGLVGVRLRPVVPTLTLPGLVTCMLQVLVLAPDAMLKLAPAGQTTLGVPVAVSVPDRPPV